VPSWPSTTRSALAALQAANRSGAAPDARAELESLARLLVDAQYPAAVERVHGLFREHSPAAVPALELFTSTAIRRARAGDARQIDPLLGRLQELPTSEAKVRGPLARLLATMALASAREGQSERSKQQARTALTLDESTPDAYLALGEYQFQDNDLSAALDTWERGLRLNPDDPSLARRLERGRAEAQRLGGLERVASEHFVVAFDGRADVPGARASLEIMEAAYRSVGSLFQLYPDGPIPVVLYPDRSYAEEGHVSWSAGVYDGKIRLPSAGASVTSLRFRGTLFHEYAHALFHRVTGRKGGPAWLNEGFASVAGLQGDPGPSVRCTSDVHLFPLRNLEGSFGQIGNHKQAHLAYLEGRHAVERIIERHGQAGVRGHSLRDVHRAPFATAFERALERTTPPSPRRSTPRGTADTSAAMNLELEGKRAVVTGSTAGIGWAIAAGLAAEGADVRPERAHRGTRARGPSSRSGPGNRARGSAASRRPGHRRGLRPHGARGPRRWTSW
jgi:tetratricopeptide (TPR) repeat protein